MFLIILLVQIADTKDNHCRSERRFPFGGGLSKSFLVISCVSAISRRCENDRGRKPEMNKMEHANILLLGTKPLWLFGASHLPAIKEQVGGGCHTFWWLYN
jgi:hypothetical protein